MRPLRGVRVVVVIASFSIAGCAAITLHPGAERVKLTNQEPQGCEHLTEITGSQGNPITGGWTSNHSLAEGARNDLKNKALEKGANVVHVLTSRDGHTIGQYGGSKTSSSMEGVAYRCPNESKL